MRPASHSFRSFPDWLNAGAFDLLGELYPDAETSTNLLAALGASMGTVLAFGHSAPKVWWASVGRRADQGALPFTIGDLLRAASGEHPGNTKLAALLDRTGTAAVAGPIRVLMLQASPTNLSRLRLDVEYKVTRDIGKARPDRIAFELSPATRTSVIVTEILVARPAIIHFAGHGTGDGHLLFETDAGLAQPVEMDAFAAAVAPVAPITAVLLSACFAARYVEALRPYTKAVIGSVDPLADPVAIAFTRGFYTALAEGYPVRGAYAAGVAEIRLIGAGPDTMRLIDGSAP